MLKYEQSEMRQVLLQKARLFHWSFVCIIDEQKARDLVARPEHGRPGTAQARHGPEDTGPGLGTARVPGRAWAARQARRVARHGPQLVEGMVEAR